MAAGFLFALSGQVERPDDLAALRERATPVGDRSLLEATNLIHNADATNTQPVELVSAVDRAGFRFPENNVRFYRFPLPWRLR